VTIFVKQVAVCLALIRKLPKIDAVVLELVLMQTKPCSAIKLASKVGNLGLKIDMQYARRAKLGRMTGKLPKLDAKWVFLNRKAEMLSNNNSKISNSPSSLFLGKERKICG
jgi:hypothetical protein